MITIEQYFGHWIDSEDVTEKVMSNAQTLLNAVDRLMDLAKQDGIRFMINPHTNSCVSGSEYGGFRPQSCKIGASNSSHKSGLAVDLYDPLNEIDNWCMQHSDEGGLLEQCGIYIEHPSCTIKGYKGASESWSHWNIKLTPQDSPKSGKRVFYP